MVDTQRESKNEFPSENEKFGLKIVLPCFRRWKWLGLFGARQDWTPVAVIQNELESKLAQRKWNELVFDAIH